MKALSIKQPWAWLICKGIKDVENRTWHIHMPPLLNYPATPRRIYIHASKVIDDGAWNFIHHRVSTEIWDMIRTEDFYRSLVKGAIIGEVDIIGCQYRNPSAKDPHIYSVWHEVGMYGLLLANPILYDKPIPMKGKLGFFEPDIPVRQEIK
jgi:hypothetical protein